MQLDRSRRCTANKCNFFPMAGADRCYIHRQDTDEDMIEGPPMKSAVAFDVPMHESEHTIQSYFDNGWEHYNSVACDTTSGPLLALFFRKGG